ncbi:MAG: MurT ligase domain-containing protein [Saccharofermentanales bacterium]
MSVVLSMKLMIKVMRLLRRNATTLPGKAAFLIAKGLPEYLTSGQNVTMITGTNGKTTTARMVCSIYEKSGCRVVSNVSGANLISGIITTLIEKLSVMDIREARARAKSKDLHGDSAPLRIVLETDEGAFGRFAGRLNPAVTAVTNLFRDQLDRYGELTMTRELIRKGIESAPDSAAVLCADDSLSASMFPAGRKKLLYCGISDRSMNQDTKDSGTITEAGSCIFCGTAYEYRYRTYGHLGSYHCPGCGFTRPSPDLEGDYSHLGNNLYNLTLNIRAPGYFDFHEDSMDIRLPIPGEYNVYNAITAAGTAIANMVSISNIREGIEDSKAGFGRMEKFEVGGREVCIVLVKNPAGLERALSFLDNASDAGSVQFLLNDNIADGTDVSWIWDVDFESRRFAVKCHVSGTRCYDMALRLKYAGVLEEQISVDPDYASGFETALKQCRQGRCLYVFPNYTSLISLRSYLEKKYRLSSIWE